MSRTTADAAAGRAGRRLDTTRNPLILDAALEVLAETGYEGMTIDAVAARAGAARATVYRRWATKADLVVDAVRHMSRSDAERAPLPDTGSLRDDLIATIVPQSVHEQSLRIRVMSGLVGLAATDPRLAESGAASSLEPWEARTRALIQRAVDRGEFAHADVDRVAAVLPMMCVCRVAVQQQPVTADFVVALIDGVVIPAMRGGGR